MNQNLRLVRSKCGSSLFHLCCSYHSASMPEAQWWMKQKWRHTDTHLPASSAQFLLTCTACRDASLVSHVIAPLVQLWSTLNVTFFSFRTSPIGNFFIAADVCRSEPPAAIDSCCSYEFPNDQESGIEPFRQSLIRAYHDEDTSYFTPGGRIIFRVCLAFVFNCL